MAGDVSSGSTLDKTGERPVADGAGRDLPRTTKRTEEALTLFGDEGLSYPKPVGLSGAAEIGDR